VIVTGGARGLRMNASLAGKLSGAPTLTELSAL